MDPSKGTNTWVWNFDLDNQTKIKRVQGLRLTLPPRAIKNLKVNTRSGDVSLHRVALDELEVDASSGDVHIEDSEVLRFARVDTKSGDIQMSGFKGKLRASSTSGEIEGDHITAEELDTHSTSGDINLSLVDAKGLRAAATSGDITVTLPSATGWKFTLSATSGEIKSDFADDEHANKFMQIRTTSGDIRITR